MQEAMNENNYHLQYHIYTVAAVKYLSQKLQDFDYAKHFGGVCYLFVRGVRSNQQTGIYLARPTWETIQELYTGKGSRQPICKKVNGWY
jgi:exodeoxyribonuclease V beta subunit